MDPEFEERMARYQELAERLNRGWTLTVGRDGIPRWHAPRKLHPAIKALEDLQHQPPLQD
ncbi:hypothetical protein ACFOGJ_16040 [Marinibaculum pumilum]|uniref:TubC N-terminal docking domain-containing protein n=1 Tax=Marinibaculum pumilum TaxID=1766165 RepID=A0ABV7L2A6_9PROT